MAREAAAAARLANEPIWVWYRRLKGKRAHAFNDAEGAHNGTTVAACRRYLPDVHGGKQCDPSVGAARLKPCPGCRDVVNEQRAREDVRTELER